MKLTYEEIGTRLDIIEQELTSFGWTPEERKKLENDWVVLNRASRELWKDKILIDDEAIWR
jgi:hypothetical protein